MQRHSFYRRTFVHCRYCNTTHWSDECLQYQTANNRKQKLINCCFLCLRHGHIAHKCKLNKSCFYCGRENHHHRSLCPVKFTAGVRCNSDETATETKRKSCQTSNTNQKSNNQLARYTEKGIKQEEMKIAKSNTNIREYENVEHIAEPYTDVRVPTTEINSRVTDQILIMDAVMVHDICKQTELETEEGNDKIIKENIELRMKFIEFDNNISSITEELV